MSFRCASYASSSPIIIIEDGSNLHEILYRTDRSGNITHYQEYDKDGDPVKRVDLTGRSHGMVPTPHVAEFERHITPSGKAFLKLPKTVRPARPDEIP